MTSNQYRAALAALGLTQRAAAQLFGVGERQSRRWALGEANVPRAVVIALRLMMEFDVEPDKFMPGGKR